jgi:hypothetical protein
MELRKPVQFELAIIDLENELEKQKDYCHCECCERKMDDFRQIIDHLEKAFDLIL